jgi:hypothetical protein
LKGYNTKSFDGYERNFVATGFFVALVGFLKSVTTFNCAKKKLKGDFGKLKKQLVEDIGLHENAQERYMAITRNNNLICFNRTE